MVFQKVNRTVKSRFQNAPFKFKVCRYNEGRRKAGDPLPTDVSGDGGGGGGGAGGGTGGEAAGRVCASYIFSPHVYSRIESSTIPVCFEPLTVKRLTVHKPTRLGCGARVRVCVCVTFL